ncbi:MAG TPA: hypothetical protein VJ734_08445 [Nitrosospira sp.]|nr:hypothetical protein [Nitrosospira sp.]
MTMFRRKRIRDIKEEIERQYAAAEADADRLMDKLKASKWTVAILLGGVLFAFIFLWSLS